jgi:hypothetical protein
MAQVRGKFSSGVGDISGKVTASVNNTGPKFVTGAKDAVVKFATVVAYFDLKLHMKKMIYISM